MTAPQAEQLRRQVAAITSTLLAMLDDFEDLEEHGYAGGGSGGAGRHGGDVDPTGDAAVGFQQGAGDEDPEQLSPAGQIRRKLDKAAEYVAEAGVRALRSRAAVAAARKLTNPELATKKVSRWTENEAHQASQEARARVQAEGREARPRGAGGRGRSRDVEAWRHESEQAVSGRDR